MPVCWRRRLLSLFLPLVLGACSMVQTVYNQSHSLAYWWIDGYTDLTAEQRPLVTQDLLAYQQWHRKTQLPGYQLWLQQLQALAPHDVTPAQACGLYNEVWNSLPTLLAQAEAGTTRLVRSLSAEQVAHLRRKLERTHRDWRRDWVEPSAADALDKRVQRALERAEDFYGRLDAGQRQLLRSQAENSPYDVALAETLRLRRQQDIVETLSALQKRAPDEQDSQSQIRGLMQRSLNSPDPTQQAYVRRLNDYNCLAMAKLHNSTSPAQREAALKRLQKYERDIRALIER